MTTKTDKNPVDQNRYEHQKKLEFTLPAKHNATHAAIIDSLSQMFWFSYVCVIISYIFRDNSMIFIALFSQFSIP